MIIGLIGRMGTGKTLSLVRYAWLYYKQGFKIYSNITLNFPHVKIGLQDLINYANTNTYLDKSVVLLDEAHISLLDSRNSMSVRNRVLTHLIVLSRKMGFILFYTTQMYHQVDKRLRSNTDVLIKCSTKKYKNENYTHNLIMLMMEFGMKIKTDIFKSSQYYNMYNTRELVKIE
jgi:hypothetical protein